MIRFNYPLHNIISGTRMRIIPWSHIRSWRCIVCGACCRNYDVVLTVTDNSSNSTSDTTFAWIQETNNPPNKPTITGETHGKVGIEYDYKFETIDTDENPVWYMVEWGDGASSGWFGPYISGQQLTLSHTWFREDTFTIKAKVKDENGLESDWIILSVSMPKNKTTQTLLLRFLEQHPHLSQLLKQLLNKIKI